ncbi:MAG TPA: T9SS type A sorting domain-containing protein, partial [Candidatus Babeliaceae bacterium]|nr:T9SS type A sorting domain-containing protein [Candidatus Babeliaceae bacterium]
GYGLKMLYKIPDNFSVNNDDQVFGFSLGLDSALRSVLYGYNIQDEPRVTDIVNVNNWNVAISQKDSRKLGYVNLLPVYGFESHQQYESYLREFLSNAHNLTIPLSVVSYDFYPFTNVGMRLDYFYNLSLINRMADSRPFWFYVQTVSHSIYDDPTQFQLEFQIFCPLVYGAKGYVFYTYETIPVSKNYSYGDAIISRSGEPSNKYQIISAINHYVHDIPAPVIMNSTFLGAFHVSNATYGQYIPQDEYVSEKMPVLSQISNQNVLAGIFKSNINDGEYNVLIMNKADIPLDNIPLSIRGDQVGHVMLSRKLNDSPNLSNFKFINSSYDEASNLTRLSINLAPGELRVLKVLYMNDPLEKVNYPTKFGLSVYPNPLASTGTIVYSLSQSSTVSLKIFSTDGRLRKTILPPVHLAPGKYYYYLSALNLRPGLYIITMLANDEYRGSQKLVVK